MGQRFYSRIKVSGPNGTWVDSQTGGPGGGRKKAVENGRVEGDTVTWSTPEVSITRTVYEAGTHLEVVDQFVNRTDRLVGVMVQDTTHGESAPQGAYLCGGDITGVGDRQKYDPGNPSVYASYGSGGLGVVEVNDTLRAQGKIGLYQATGMSLLDDCLGIVPGGSQTLEWSLYPTPSDDYWAFVNLVRSDWNVKTTINGPISWEPGGWETNEKSSPKDQSFYGQWATERGLLYVGNVITHFDDGSIADGTALPLAVKGLSATKSWMGKVQAATPTAKSLIYFHAQACSEPGAETKYSDSMKFDANGQEVTYPSALLANKQRLPLFLPTLDDSYGLALLATLNNLVTSPEIGGIYWDEMSGSFPENSKSGVAFGNVWDESTVQIDLATHQVVRKEVNVPLVTQHFEEKAVGVIRSAGKALLANTEPYTKTMMDLHIERFVEGAGKNIPSSQLGVPFVLANMRYEQTPAEAMEDAVSILNQGAVFCAWRELWTPPATDFYRLMFPITPVDIRPGIITGEERILTSKSGDYGFKDGSPAQVYVFDASANAVASNNQASGNNVYRVSVPTGGMAILVKQ